MSRQVEENIFCHSKGKKKVKGFPLQSWNGSWGSRRLRLLDLLDFRHYEGSKVVTVTHWPALPPGVFLVLICRDWVDPRAHGSVGSFVKNPQPHHWGSSHSKGLLVISLFSYQRQGTKCLGILMSIRQSLANRELQVPAVSHLYSVLPTAICGSDASAVFHMPSRGRKSGTPSHNDMIHTSARFVAVSSLDTKTVQQQTPNIQHCQYRNNTQHNILSHFHYRPTPTNYFLQINSTDQSPSRDAKRHS